MCHMAAQHETASELTIVRATLSRVFTHIHGWKSVQTKSKLAWQLSPFGGSNSRSGGNAERRIVLPWS